MAIMDLHRSDVQTDIQGGVEFSFSKDAASKLYQMMSNYLYSDKEYAVISELSANAVDAHALVNKKNVPITIQLPTRLESEFVVRDYGPGLPEDAVYRFLTSYGESSKGGSNDQIGFWGIGSKSPAAVSDSWSVISHHDGKRSHYEVFITEAGIPTLKKIFEGESDETGLEVRVPVSLTNHQQWVNAALRAFKYYDVKPNFNVSLNFPVQEYANIGNGWGRVRTGASGRLLVTMREYQLDFGKVMAEVDSNAPMRQLFASNWANMNFMFGVGEINLSISREQIQYDKKTIDSIKAKLEVAYNEFKALIEADLNAAEDSIDYRKRVNKWYEDQINPNFLVHIIDGKYGINQLPRDIARVTAKMVEDDHIQAVSAGRLKKVNARFSCWGNSAISVDSNWDHKNQRYEHTLGLRIGSLDRIQVVIRDVRDAVSRIKHSGDSNKYYLLVDKSPFISEIKTVLASSFDKPERISSKEERGELSGFYVLTGSRFLKIDKNKFLGYRSKDCVIAVKIGNAITSGSDETIIDKKVKFLVDQSWSVIGYKENAPKGVKTVDEGLKYVFDQLANDPELKKSIADHAMRNLFKQVGGCNIALLAIKIDVNSDKWNDLIAPMKPVIDHYAKYKAPVSGGYTPYQFTTWIRLCKLLGVDDKTAGVVDLQPTFDTMIKNYPLLKFVHQSWYGEVQDPEAIRDYIKMIDEKI